MVASSEGLASMGGMRVLELGGNAFDAAIATCLCLWHTESGQCAPGAECAITCYPAGGDGRIYQCCGQGRMPMAATLEKYAELGYTGPNMPSGTLLTACTPGAYDALMLLLAAHGTMRPRDVFAPFMDYCGEGVPISPGTHNSLGRSAKRYVDSGSAWASLLDAEGNPPPRDGVWRQPLVFETFSRLLATGEAAGAQLEGEARRQAEIEAMRLEWRTGFVAVREPEERTLLSHALSYNPHTITPR
jgi:gamma-glutamyltranspeptidase/glutathione hydrolase